MKVDETCANYCGDGDIHKCYIYGTITSGCETCVSKKSMKQAADDECKKWHRENLSEPNCSECAFCAKLYIPGCYQDIIESLGYTDRNIHVCNLFLAEHNEVMWLGKETKGGCEMWIDKRRLK